MGSLLSRWRDNKSTIEILEEIDKDISRLEKFSRSNQEMRSRVIGNWVLYSVLAYVIACVMLYFLFIPKNVMQRCLQVFPFLCFPVLIYLMKRFLHWWFVRKISRNEHELRNLKEQKKDILENVMETETYKKAKEILEKFDPETKKKLEEERNQRMNPTPQPTPGTEMRRRMPRPGPSMIPPQPPNSPPRLTQQTPMATPHLPNNNMTHGGRIIATPSLPRPILQQNRSAMEKLVEYFVGDGPGNRYALICKNCFSHNGMALKEEFEYIEYRCAYCQSFNGARKQRPSAPKLPESSPKRKLSEKEKSDEQERDSGNDGSATPSPSSSSSQNNVEVAQPEEDETMEVVENDENYKPKRLEFIANEKVHDNGLEPEITASETGSDQVEE